MIDLLVGLLEVVVFAFLFLIIFGICFEATRLVLTLVLG